MSQDQVKMTSTGYVDPRRKNETLRFDAPPAMPNVKGKQTKKVRLIRYLEKTSISASYDGSNSLEDLQLDRPHSMVSSVTNNNNDLSSFDSGSNIRSIQSAAASSSQIKSLDYAQRAHTTEERKHQQLKYDNKQHGNDNEDDDDYEDDMNDVSIDERHQNIEFDKQYAAVSNRKYNKNMNEITGPIMESKTGDLIQYIPKHYSSGALSVVLYDTKSHHIGPVVNSNNNLLWADDKTTESMEEKELRLLRAKYGLNHEQVNDPRLIKQFEKEAEDKKLIIEAMQLLFQRQFQFSDVKLSKMAANKKYGLLQMSTESIELQAFAANLRVQPKLYRSLDELMYGSKGKDDTNRKAPVVTRHTKEKLLNLGKFVADHANRKLQASWEAIQTRFEQSPYTKTLMEGNASGLLHPVKYNALRCSGLVGILCSTKVRAKHNEVSTILRKLGYSDDDIFLGRQISASRAVLAGIKELQNNASLNNMDKVFLEDANKNFERVSVQLKEMLKREDVSLLISIKEFRQNVFPLETVTNDNELESNEDSKKSVTLRPMGESLPGLRVHVEAKISEIMEENRKLDLQRERFEKMKRQAIIDFDDVVHTVQKPYPGALSIGRHEALKCLIEYCDKIVALKIAENDITVSDELLSFLGIEAFPLYVQQAIIAKKNRTKADLDRIRKTIQYQETKQNGRVVLSRRNSKFTEILEDTYLRFPRARPASGKSKAKNRAENADKALRPEDALTGFHGHFRLKFTGLLHLLHVMISHDKSLFGYTTQEVAELMQSYGSTRIQTVYRGYRRRWRYKHAIKLASQKLRRFLFQHYNEWKIVTEHNKLHYKYCFRKIRAWRYYVLRMKRLREYFRICYWPFFVWRRTTNNNLRAREKTKFLVGRVMPTYKLLVVFHEWKKYIQKNVLLSHLITTYQDKINKKNKMKAFKWYTHWTKRNIRLRKAWNKSSLQLASRRRIYDLKNLPMTIWKLYTLYQKLIHTRVKQYAITCRSHLLPNSSPMETYTTDERRRHYRAYKRRVLLAELDEIERERERLDLKEKMWTSRGRQKVSASTNAYLLDVKNPDDSMYSKKTIESDTISLSLFDKYDHNGNTTAYRFEWKARPICYDFDSDDEEDIIRACECSPTIRAIVKYCSAIPIKVDKQTHSSSNNDIKDKPIVDEFLDLTEISFLKHHKYSTLMKLMPLYSRLRIADMWGIFEGSIRFHRYAAKCFKNFRSNAIIRRNARLSLIKRKKIIMRRAFIGLVAWMERDPAYIKGLDVQTDSEIMANVVRRNRLERLTRRRVATQEIEAYYGRHNDTELYTDAVSQVSITAVNEAYDYNKLSVEQPDFEYLKDTNEGTLSDAPTDRDRRPKRKNKTNKKKAKGTNSNPTDGKVPLASIRNRPVASTKSQLSSTKTNKKGFFESSASMKQNTDDQNSTRRRINDQTSQNSADNRLGMKSRGTTIRSEMGSRDDIPGTSLNDSSVISQSSYSSGLEEISSITHETEESGSSSGRVLTVDIKSNTLSKLVRRLSVSKPIKLVAKFQNTAKAAPIPDAAQLSVRQKAPFISKLNTAMSNRSLNFPLSPLPESREEDVNATGEGLSTIPEQNQPDGIISTNNSLTTYQPPNFLTWDRQDREIERHLVEQIAVMSTDYYSKTINNSSDAGLKTIIVQDLKYARDKILNEIMRSEDDVTSQAIKNELEYVSKFHVFAGANLVNAVYKVFNEINNAMIKNDLRFYFRTLRMPMLLRRSQSMLQRKRLQNWIRICRRLAKMNERMPYYHAVRTKWIVYNRWLKYVLIQSTNCTAQYVRTIKRRCELYKKFSDKLKSFGIVKMVYLNNSRLRTALNDPTTVFYRWVSYIQEKIIFRGMEERALLQYRLKLLQKCYRALKTVKSQEENIEYYSHPGSSGEDRYNAFSIIRVKADLAQTSRYFVSNRNKSLIETIRSYNKRYSTIQKQQGKTAMSFKRLLADNDRDISYRLVTELRILAESFDSRGDMKYIDVHIPDRKYIADGMVDDHVIGTLPAIMRHLEGRSIHDPKIDPSKNDSDLEIDIDVKGNNAKGQELTKPFKSGDTSNDNSFESIVPAGYQLRRIRFNVSEQEQCIIGWQILWGGDGVPDIESPFRGRWVGHQNKQDLLIPKDDFAIGLEYFYGGACITCIRLKLMHGGWTKWIGSKGAAASTSVYLHANMASSKYDDDYVYAGVDEEDHPAVPRSYIMGLSGVEMAVRGKISALGLIVRKIYDQNIFSYFWVHDAINKRALEAQKQNQNISSLIDAMNEKQAKQSNDVDSESTSAVSSRRQSAVAFNPTSTLSSIAEINSNKDNLSPTSNSITSKQTARSRNSIQSGHSNQTNATQQGDKGNTISLPIINRLLKQKKLMDAAECETYSDHSSAWGAIDDGCYFDGSDEGTDDSNPPSPTEKVTVTHRRNSSNKPSTRKNSTITVSSGLTAIMGTQKIYSNLNQNGVAGGKSISTWGSSGVGENPSMDIDRDNDNKVQVLLTPSEQQFFDIIRMRTAEVKVAQIRAERLARHLWTSRHIKKDPRLHKLVSIKIISGLSRWYFESLARRLVEAVASEKRGIEIMGQSHMLRIKAEILRRQSERSHVQARILESKTLPWSNKSLLSPAERQERQDYKETLDKYRSQAKLLEKQSTDLLNKARIAERQGKLLLPRIQLSQYVCNNIWLKVAAARTKESLLERVSLTSIKEALCGLSNSTGTVGLSNVTMETVKKTLLARRDMQTQSKSLLEQVLEDEIENEKNRKSEVMSETLNEFDIAANNMRENRRRQSIIDRKLKFESIFSDSKVKPKHQKMLDRVSTSVPVNRPKVQRAQTSGFEKTRQTCYKLEDSPSNSIDISNSQVDIRETAASREKGITLPRLKTTK